MTALELIEKYQGQLVKVNYYAAPSGGIALEDWNGRGTVVLGRIVSIKLDPYRASEIIIEFEERGWSPIDLIRDGFVLPDTQSGWYVSTSQIIIDPE